MGNTDGHFEETEIVNFDIIHRWYRGEEFQKEYQTVGHEDVIKYPESDQQRIFSCAFRTERKYIYFEDKSIKNILVKIVVVNKILRKKDLKKY